MNIHKIIQSIVQKSPAEVDKHFESAMANRVMKQIEIKRAEVGSNLFNKASS